MKHMIDLFSGLGGASRAFEDREDWKVHRYENNAELAKHPSCSDYMVADIVTHDFKELDDIEVKLLWASPPCNAFSNGFASAKSVAARAKNPYEPSLGLVTRTIELIERFTPHYWVIENVVGAIKYFRPLLGEPRMILGSVVLWGNFPLFEADVQLGHKAVHNNSYKKWRPNLRAEIPLEISRALLEAVNMQKSLGDY